MDDQEDRQKILIIEDEELYRKPLAMRLNEEGYEVIEESNGEKGLHTAFDTHPDLILLDISVPSMDGLTIMENLRKDEWGSNATIIILTNFGINEEKRKELMADSPSYYLLKADTSLDDVTAKVKEVLEVPQEDAASL